MSEIQIFDNPEFGSVRTVEVNGEHYFVGKDICSIFGDKNHNRSLGRVSDDDKITVEVIDSMGRKQSVTAINESGLYSLMFAMQPQRANNNGVTDAYPIETQQRIERLHRFKRWVTHEVLPSIRKHGAYMTDEALHRAIIEPDFLIKLATELKEEKEKRKALESKVEQDKPLVDFATQVSKSSDLIDIAQMAKLAQDENINIGRNKLFEWLREKKILMNNNNPYQRFIDQGFFQLKEITKNTPYGDKIFLKTLVTGKGQIYIIQKLKTEFCN